MKLEFGKYTEITKFAKSVNEEFFGQYEKVYICPDTQNWWLSCILKGYNSEYERDDRACLIERDSIDYETERLLPKYLTFKNVKKIVEEWEGECWDNTQVSTLEEAIDIIDGGFGIIGEDD